MTPRQIDKTRFKRLLTLSVLLPLVLMAALAGVLLWQVVSLLSVTGRVEHTNRVIAAAHRTEKLLVDMETGLRGYLLTADPNFLEPYRQALPQIDPSLDELGGLVADNPQQLRRLDEVRSLYAQWGAYARDLIALREQGGDYVPVVAGGRGKRLTDAMRAELASFVRTEEELRDVRTRAARRATRLSVGAVVGLTLLLGVLLAFSTLRQLTTVSRSYGQVIAELEAQAESLRRSEERFRLLVEGVQDYAIFMLDTEGRVASWNAGAERITGYRADEITGRHFSLFYTDEDRQSGRPARELKVAADEGRYEEEGWRVRRDGTRFWANVVVSALRDDEGNLRGFAKVTRDITERRRAEEERERFLAVGADLLVIAGFDGRFKWVGPAWERVLGWSSEELTSHPWLHFVHPEDQERTIAEAEKVFAGQEIASFENRYRHKDGSYRWISWKVRPYVREQSIYGAAADVTERKQLEEQLRQSQKLESVGQLAGGIAHDFNNLLTVITGYSDLVLRRSQPDEAVRVKIEEIKNAAERAASLTRQLLAFSRKQVLEPKVLDLTETVAGMDKMLQRLIGEDVQLVTMLEHRLAKVKADPGQIEQVIMNLAVNARDAMPGGGKLTIETKNVYLDEAYARRHATVTPGPYVMVAVSDTGVGMDAATMERIFEPFFTTKEAGKGTGLGLSMVYGIVKQSGGNIWVYSEPGHGTTFKVYLPAVGEEGESRDEGVVARERARGTETVLLVEDEEAVRRLLLDILETEGYTVLVAADGHDALQACERHAGPIHLLMTDVVMPGMSGRELVERLAGKCADVKVLYMSGYTDNAIVHHGVLDPGVAFLQKPFTPDAVVRKVREVLDGHHGG